MKQKYLYIILIILFINISKIVAFDLNQATNWFKEYYTISEEDTQKLIPFGFYVNEAGFMLGAFYYNTNILASGAQTSLVAMYSPETQISTIWADFDNISLTNKTSLYSTINILKFNDARIYWKGNDSPNIEVSYTQLPDGSLIPKNKGYHVKEGWANNFKVGLKHQLLSNNALYGEYRYNVSTSNNSDDSLTDEVILRFESSFLDNKINPRKGSKFIADIAKSIDLLGHDANNNWDYYRLSGEIIHFIPLPQAATLAFRLYSVHLGGKKVVDETRTAFMNNILNDQGRYTEYAPFMAQAYLGYFDNFRGYYMYRFRDNNLLSLQMENRFPISGNRLYGVLFGEVGRVAEEYKISNFLQDMKYSYGAGVRFYFNPDIIVRADIGHSNEELMQVRIMFGQAF
jgi:outer membrane protein assembly factor BamA